MGFLSRFLNSFKSMRLNVEKPVDGYLLDHLLVGSMYAEQQSAYLNSYETGMNKSDLKTIVETYWGISDQNQCIEILQSLHSRNQDENLDVVYKAFENSENYADILRSNLSNQDGVFEYYLDLFRKLRSVVPELIEQKIITDLSQLKKAKDSGWNYGRGVFLARCCYELDYISEKELIAYLAKSHIELKKYCNTWKEYTTSYIFGRAIWSGGSNNGMVQIANDLLNNHQSPLKNRTYL